MLGKHSSPKPKSKAKKTVGHKVFCTILFGASALYQITKAYNSNEAYMKYIQNCSDELEDNQMIDFLQIAKLVDSNGNTVNVNPDSKILLEILVCAQSAEGDDLNPAMKKQGGATAAKFQTVTLTFMRNGKATGNPNSASFAYLNNDVPGYLNKVIGGKSVTEVVAQLFSPYIVDGSFYDQSKEVIATYFKDANVGEVAK